MLKKHPTKSKKRNSSIDTTSITIKIALVIFVNCIITIAFSLNFGNQSMKIFDDIIHKAYEVMNTPLEKIYNFMKSSKDLINYKDEREILVQENQKLKEQVLRIDIIDRENFELKQLIKYINPHTFNYISAKVVSANFYNFGLQMMLNVGIKNGISEGQAVINSAGIVGRVINVSSQSSKIMTWNNVNFKIPIVLLKSGIHCIANGANNNIYMKLVHLPENIRPIEGEIAITSGEGGILPAGIRVGKIERTELEEEKFIVKPAANIDLFSIVLVATSIVNH